MIMRQGECPNGLFTGISSQTTREICQSVHSVFLDKHRLTFWTVAVVPFDDPGLRVFSEAPDGARISGVIQKTATFASDLMIFLDGAHADWLARGR